MSATGPTVYAAGVKGDKSAAPRPGDAARDAVHYVNPEPTATAPRTLSFPLMPRLSVYRLGGTIGIIGVSWGGFTRRKRNRYNNGPQFSEPGRGRNGATSPEKDVSLTAEMYTLAYQREHEQAEPGDRAVSWPATRRGAPPPGACQRLCAGTPTTRLGTSPSKSRASCPKA